MEAEGAVAADLEAGAELGDAQRPGRRCGRRSRRWYGVAAVAVVADVVELQHYYYYDYDDDACPPPQLRRPRGGRGGRAGGRWGRAGWPGDSRSA